MKNFVQFIATGVIYKRDNNGRKIGIKERRYGTGVTLDCPELPGKVFSQCPP